MLGKGTPRLLATYHARVVQLHLPSAIRGRRECRALDAPAALRVVTTVTPENARHSPRNGFTAYTALSPVTGLSCHRRLADTSARLDSSVGASGPHDFAVRKITPSSEALPASTASRPAFVTIASRPCVGRDGRHIHLICISEKQKYFFESGWTKGRMRNRKRRPTGKSPAPASVARRSQRVARMRAR